MNPLYERTAALYGEEAVAKLQSTRVLILGVGGVGGYAAEQLIRAGVGTVELVDGDTVDATNLNRQIVALNSTVGRSKVEVMAERAKEINPAITVHAQNRFLRPDEAESLIAEPYDLAIDAIDDVPAKLAFLAACVRKKLPVVSAMGAGGKVDPSKIRTADISKTFGCPLAKRIRTGLREMGIAQGVFCVFSPEERRQCADLKIIGSVSFLPAAFGCFMAAAAVNLLLKKQDSVEV